MDERSGLVYTVRRVDVWVICTAMATAWTTSSTQIQWVHWLAKIWIEPVLTPCSVYNPRTLAWRSGALAPCMLDIQCNSRPLL